MDYGKQFLKISLPSEDKFKIMTPTEMTFVCSTYPALKT